MNVFTELANWVNAKKLPYWEQYALDLIVAGEEIGDEELNEMVTFLLEDGGIIKKEAPRHKLTALAKAVGAEKRLRSEKLFLRGLSATENINALVPDQKLEFGN